jgi:hypothetical protein
MDRKIITTSEIEEDKLNDNKLRPKTLSDYV